MPELLDDAQLALRQSAQDFAENFLPGVSGEDARARVIAESKARGFFAMTQPREFGGSAATALDLTIVREALAAANAPHTGWVFGSGPGVLHGCDEPLKSSHLAPMLAGAKRSAFGFTEPDDVPQPTNATVQGEQLIINGQKSYVTGGADADFINTLVHIEGSGPAIVVIDTDAPGVTIAEKFSSLDGSHHAAFRFENVKTPTAHIVGTPGEGLPRAMRQIGDTRLAFAATCTGWMIWLVNYVEAHIRAPDRSGEPRAAKEGVRMRYSDMRINTFAARSMLYRTARLADAGNNVVNESIACKVFSTEQVGLLVDTAIQLVGGGALVVGHPLESLYRRVRSMRLAEGASDVLRLNLVRGNLDLGKGRL